jgi:hypothetical protein
MLPGLQESDYSEAESQLLQPSWVPVTFQQNRTGTVGPACGMRPAHELFCAHAGIQHCLPDPAMHSMYQVTSRCASAAVPNSKQRLSKCSPQDIGL